METEIQIEPVERTRPDSTDVVNSVAPKSAAESEIDRAGTCRELLRVALPLVLSSGSISLMYVVNRIFLARYSTEAVAAALPAGMIHWLILSLPFGTTNYVNTFVAQYTGAGRRDRVAAALWQGIYFATLAGLAMVVLAQYSGILFVWMGHEAEVQRLEAEYFSILCLAAVPELLAAALACFYSGQAKTAVILGVNVAITLANIGLDFVFIFGNGIVPAMGIHGAALASVAAAWLGVVLYLAALAFDPTAKTFQLLAHRGFDRELFGRMLRFGLPNGVHMLVDVICFTLFLILVGRLGTTELAATNLAFNLNSLAFVPMLGFGTAVMTLVGQRVGEGRAPLAARTVWWAAGLTTAYMLAVGMVYVGAPDVLLAPYFDAEQTASNGALRAQIALLLRFVALYSLFDAWIIVFGSAIRGAGDTRFSLCLSLGCGVLLMVIPTYVMVRWLHAGLLDVWYAVTACVIVMGLGFLARFLGGKWQTMRVIENGP